MVNIIKQCRREGCKRLFHLKHPNQKYCSDYCQTAAKRDRIKIRVQKHRDLGNKEDSEQIRQRVENYRNRWGWQNKNEQLGSGRLSPKMNPNFEVESKLIKWEKRRLGIK